MSNVIALPRAFMPIIIIKKTFSENTVVHYYCFYYSQGETSEYQLDLTL